MPPYYLGTSPNRLLDKWVGRLRRLKRHHFDPITHPVRFLLRICLQNILSFFFLFSQSFAFTSFFIGRNRTRSHVYVIQPEYDPNRESVFQFSHLHPQFRSLVLCFHGLPPIGKSPCFSQSIHIARQVNRNYA